MRLFARGLIALTPESVEQTKARERLRAEVKDLPKMRHSGNGAWSRHRIRLRRDILTKDPRTFATWDVIAATMLPPPYARFVRQELRFLQRQDWATWSHVMRSNWIFRANAIHQAYHLCRFQMEAGAKIRDFDFILEFGGGYGEMRRIVDQLGFRGDYAIVDLPEQNALQRYYLGTLGDPATAIVSTIGAVNAMIDSQPRGSRKLFVATWSLDETPLETRAVWTDLLSGFDAFLIAYQANFEGVDNEKFFAEFQKRCPHIYWITSAIPQLKRSFYTFGTASAGWP